MYLVSQKGLNLLLVAYQVERNYHSSVNAFFLWLYKTEVEVEKAEIKVYVPNPKNKAQTIINKSQNWTLDTVCDMIWHEPCNNWSNIYCLYCANLIIQLDLL